MPEQLQADLAARLEHEKLESLKELAYGASHEINNPLANIAARAQTLLEDEADPERRRKLAAIHRQALRAHEMISDLMLFARPPKLMLAPCDVARLVRKILAEHAPISAERAITLTAEVGDESGLLLLGDETQLGVAIAALVVNAIEAVGTGGNVHVVLRTESDAESRWAEIVVRDDGPGIAGEVRQHMFDPFFSGREAGRGLGFGLSKCWRIVTDHGGRVIVNQPAQRGAEIAIRLPLPNRIPT
jgi:signal transduction histidine kinase